MELAWKGDAEEACRRLEAWWHGEVLDRVCIKITAPLKPGVVERGPEPTEEELEEWWTDPEQVVGKLEAYLPGCWYGGEAFPVMFPVSIQMPAILANYLGSPLRLVGTETGWCEPIIEDWEHCPELRLNEGNKWYRKSVALLRKAGEAARGKCLVGVPGFNGPGEILAQLRGSERLAIDLVDNPEHVHETMGKINRLWLECWEKMNAIIHEYVEGYLFWMSIWSERPATDLQCDSSIMISNRMFREFFLGHIEQQTEWVERTIYHLDGPGAVRHLESLLELPKLTGVQWVPGAGAAPMSQWMPLLRRIQEAGKLAYVECEPKEVGAILKGLKPAGLLISTHTATVEEGKALLRLVERQAGRRRR